MELDKLQKILDADKWYESEKAQKDMCGFMPYCVKCTKTGPYPCACAYKAFYAKEAVRSSKTSKF